MRSYDQPVSRKRFLGSKLMLSCMLGLAIGGGTAGCGRPGALQEANSSDAAGADHSSPSGSATLSNSGARSTQSPSNVPDGQPYVSPSFTPVPSVTLRATAFDKSPDSASNFVEDYARALNAAFRDPAKSRLSEWSLETCMTCSDYDKKVQLLVQGDWRGTNDLFTLSNLKATASGGNSMIVTAMVKESNLKMVNSQGFITETPPKASQPYRFTLSWDGRKWSVSAIDKGL